jgi:hypothetical protein
MSFSVRSSRIQASISMMTTPMNKFSITNVPSGCWLGGEQVQRVEETSQWCGWVNKCRECKREVNGVVG